MGLKTQNGDFLENGSNDFGWILIIYGHDYCRENSIGGVLGNITVRARRAQEQNVDSLETGITDFIAVR
jgi:hypothetical protein